MVYLEDRSGECSMHGLRDKFMKIFIGKLEGKDHLENLVVEER
jgi:hypothetical protein